MRELDRSLRGLCLMWEEKGKDVVDGGYDGRWEKGRDVQNVFPGSSHLSLPAASCAKKSFSKLSLLPSTIFFDLSSCAFRFFSSCCSAVRV